MDSRKGGFKHSARLLAAKIFKTFSLDQSVKAALMSIQERSGVFSPNGWLPWPGVDEQIRGVVRRSPELPALVDAANNGNVLFVVPRGIYYDLVLQAAISYRLLFERCSSSFLVCQRLPRCNNRDIQTERPESPCGGCESRNSRFLQIAGIPVHTIDELVGDARREQADELARLTLDEIRQYRMLGYDLGRLVFPAVARFLLREDLSGEDETLVESVYRDFVFGGAMILRALLVLIEKDRPDAMVFVNGKLLWSSVAQAVCERTGVRPVSYEDIGSRFVGRTWVFNSPAPIMDLDFGVPWSSYESKALTPEEEARLDAALSGRRQPGVFYQRMEQERGRIEQELGITADDRPIALFTNVTWDTAALQKEVGFKGVQDWVIRTVRHYAGSSRPVIIRSHPAEVTAFDGTMSRELVEDAVRREFPVLPENVRIIPSASPISSYTLIQMCGFAVVYTSTFGLETALQGCPVIVAGRAHYAGKGFTFDASTAEEYLDLIDRSGDLGITDEQVELARRYAYLFFFQLPHTIDLWESSVPHEVQKLHFRQLRDLAPGRFPTLDRVVSGVLGQGLFCEPR